MTEVKKNFELKASGRLQSEALSKAWSWIKGLPPSGKVATGVGGLVAYHTLENLVTIAVTAALVGFVAVQGKKVLDNHGLNPFQKDVQE